MLQSEIVKRYNTYKDSGIEWIGEIPRNWSLVRAKHIFSQSFEKGGNDLTLLSATQNEGVIPKDRLEGVVQVKEDADLSLFKTVKKSDFVISLRSFQGGFEYSNFNGVITPAYTVFRNKIPINDNYFKMLFKSDGFIAKINSLTTGIREGKNIQYNDFEYMILPLPTLAEQQKIADYLDKKCEEIDKVIETEKSVIEKLKYYKQSIITEAVTKGLDKSAPLKDSGIEWIGKIPQHWEVCKIKNYINLQTGSTPSSNEPELLNGDYNWFTPIDFTDNFLLSNSSRKINILAKENNIVKNFPTNTVFIIGIGATTGKIGFSTIEGSCNQQITAMIVNPNNVFSKYLLYWMISNTKILRETACYTTLPIINNTTLGQYIFIKPSIEEQQQIAEYLDKKCSEIDKAIADKEQVIEKFTEYKKSLIYECVTGKKRVVA